jgi:hypothetical protein
MLTPVRRSTRKAAGAVKPATAVAAAQPLLEASNYCYKGNEAFVGDVKPSVEADGASDGAASGGAAAAVGDNV